MIDPTPPSLNNRGLSLSIHLRNFMFNSSKPRILLRKVLIWNFARISIISVSALKYISPFCLQLVRQFPPSSAHPPLQTPPPRVTDPVTVSVTLPTAQSAKFKFYCKVWIAKLNSRQILVDREIKVPRTPTRTVQYSTIHYSTVIVQPRLRRGRRFDQ